MPTYSKIIIKFNQDLQIGNDLNFDLNAVAPPAENIFFNWVALRSGANQVTKGNPTTVVGARSAINFLASFNLDYVDLGFTVSRFGNEITIVSNDPIYTFSNFIAPSSVDVEILNYSGTAFIIESISYNNGPAPCENIRIVVETSDVATKINSPIIVNNTDNPFEIIVNRGETKSLIINNNIGTKIVAALQVPKILNTNNFTLNIQNSPNGSMLTANYVNSQNMILSFSLNNIVWQSSNIFTGLNTGDYTIYVKDNFGCSFQKPFTVNSFSNLSAYFYVSKSNSIRFAKRDDFATNHKNDENTLSCEADVKLPKKEIQLFYTNDIVNGQFKSNYGQHTVTVLRENLPNVNISIFKKSNNLGQKSKMDAKIKASGTKTLIYFANGNTYDYATGAINGNHSLNGFLPIWGIKGNFINFNNTWFQIEEVIFDELLNSDVLVINSIYPGSSSDIIVSTIFDSQNYEVFEFSIPMLNYNDKKIKVLITASKAGLPDLVYLSELMDVKDLHENTIKIEYKNNSNTDVDYSTGIQFQIRQKIFFKNAINEQSSEKYKTDTNVILLTSDIYEGDEFVFEPVTKELMRKIIIALSHDNLFINGVGYVKNDSVEVEGPLGDTNLYNLKAKMLKSGNEM